MTTINDIAQKTGFSKSTVSKALQNSTRISKETREYIQKTAQELHYVPNAKAVSLRTGRNDTIGLIVPYVNYNSYYDQILYGVLSQATQFGLRCLLLPTHYQVEMEQKHLQLLRSKVVDGLIITSRVSPFNTLKEFADYGSIVLINENHPQSFLPSVNLSFLEGYHFLFDKCLNLGFKRIGLCVSRGLDTSKNAEKIKRLAQEFFPSFDDKYIVEFCQNYNDGYRAGHYFSEIVQSVDVVLANSDSIAAGILSYYKEKNRTPPFVFGQENQDIGQFLEIPSLDFQLSQAGKIAVELCLKQTLEKITVPFKYYNR